MKSSKPSFTLQGNVVLISIHPRHANMIVSGEKNVEFRRVWTDRAVEALVVYATHPEQRLAAVVEVVEVVRASKTALWRLASAEGGAISQRALSAYLTGKKQGVAIKLGRRLNLGRIAPPTKVFGPAFRAPQSFRYLTETEKGKVKKLIETRQN